MPLHVFHHEPRVQEQQQRTRSKLRWLGNALRFKGKHERNQGSEILTLNESVETSYPADPRRPSVDLSYPVISYKPSPDSVEASYPVTPKKVPTSTTSTPVLRRAASGSDRKIKGILKHASSPSSTRTSFASTASTSSDNISPLAATAGARSPLVSTTTSPYDTANDGTVGWNSDLHVRNHFEQIGWKIVPIQADGNCLFRAISDQIYRNEEFYGDIRRRIVDYIDRERDLFQPFVENEEKGRFEPISAYCTRMQKDHQWGGNPELYAAARLFNVHIVIHQGPARRIRIENDANDNVAPAMLLHLLYRNDHYDSLQDESKLHEMPPRLSTTVALDVDQEKDALVEEETASFKKKRKGVVFIGEQARIEEVEVASPHVVVHTAVRAFVRDGKIQNGFDNNNTDDVDTASPSTQIDVPTTADEILPAPVEENPVSTTPAPQDSQPAVRVVARANRVVFRNGRRVVE